MLTLQVVNVEDRSGTSEKGAYRFREVSGVLTWSDGRMQVGSMTFFERPNSPLPDVHKGKTYEVLIDVFVDRNGRIQARVSGLRPAALKAAAVS
jgi:hypothetical protein